MFVNDFGGNRRGSAEFSFWKGSLDMKLDEMKPVEWS